MKVTLDADLPIINDFVNVIIDRLNPKYAQSRYLNPTLFESSILKDATSIIWKDLDENTPGLSLLFTINENTTCFMQKLFYTNFTNITDIKGFLSLLFEIPVEILQKNILKFYDAKDNTDDYYNKITNSDEAFFTFTNSLKINSTQKFELLTLIHKPESIIPALHLLLKRIRNRIRRIYSENHTSIKKFEKLLIIRIRNESENLLNELKRIPSIRNHINSTDDFIIICSLFDEYSINLTHSSKHNLITLGIHYNQLMEALDKQFASVDSVKFLRAFSDKNRIRIIRLLTDRKMYVGQIARVCNLVMSTTSYHLDILLSAGIIKSHMRSKRVYYTLNTNFIVDKLRNIRLTLRDKSF